MSPFAVLVIYSVILMIPIIFMVTGCDKSIESSCPLYDIKTLLVLSNTVEEKTCSCGRECVGTCYTATFVLQNDNGTCTVEDSDEQLRSIANEDKDAHPVGSYMTVYVSKSDDNDCNSTSVLAQQFQIALGSLLLLTAPISLTLLYCIVWMLFMCLTTTPEEMVTICQKFCYTSFKGRTDTIHKHEIILAADRGLIFRILGCNVLILIGMLGSLIINIVELANRRKMEWLIFGTIPFQAISLIIVIYNMYQHRSRKIPYTIISFQTLLCRRALAAWLKVVTCSLSIAFGIQEHNSFGVAWNVFSIILVIIGQPKLMIRMLIVLGIWTYGFLGWFFFGLSFESDIYQLYRNCWVHQSEADHRLCCYGPSHHYFEPLLDRDHHGNEDYTMHQAMMKTHIINAMIEGVGVKLDKNDSDLIALFEVLTSETRGTLYTV